MGQVWSKAGFDGSDGAGHRGGRGSVLAVTAQNPGTDGVYGTSDDLVAPINQTPIAASVDNAMGSDCQDALDRVRGFYSFHSGGASFSFADGSVKFINESIDPAAYVALSTIAGGEIHDSPN